ncbi:hypothetical protein ATO46_02860 [Aeromonas schubertii]|uniref:tetratricopeptide repeat protein n=1 Tax=Aeromonas schubertii TaxID=652 RepID=UPI00067EFD83|nr:hypothetical protein [Aeromonas schubertii]KUE80109.1 hypothetical protein ATO46_02860 [Aeromonas schubertii]
MNQLLFLAMMMSSLSTPELELAKTSLPSELISAQAQAFNQPRECVRLADAFLQRIGENPTQVLSSSQTNSYREPLLNYRTQEQVNAALMLKGICLAQASEIQAALATLTQAQEVAQKEGFTSQLASTLYLNSRLLTRDERRLHEARPLLGQLDRLLAEPALRAHPLQVYAPLLEASLAIGHHQLEQAKDLLAKSQKAAEKSADPIQLAWYGAVQGDFYLAIRQPEMALGQYLDALKRVEGMEQHFFLGMLTAQIAALYRDEGNLKKALEFASSSADHYQNLGDPRPLQQALIALAQLNREQGDLNMALVYFFNALDLQDDRAPQQQGARLKFEIGKTYLQAGNLVLARNYLNAARQAYEFGDDKAPLVDTLQLLGELHLRQREAGIAILQLENALTLANQLGDKARQIALYRLLAGAYEQKGFYQQALASYKRFHQSSEQVRQQQTDLYQDGLEEHYQRVEREQMISQLDKTLKEEQRSRQRYQWTSILTGLSLALFIWLFFTLWLKLRTLRLQNKALGRALQKEARTGLPNWQRLLQRTPEEMAKRQQSSDLWYLTEEGEKAFDDKLHYLLFKVPFLIDCRERFGHQVACELEQAFGHYLEAGKPRDGRIYDLREGHLLYVVPQRHVTDLPRLADELIAWLDAFPSDLELDRRVALGIISYPFLPKAAGAFDHRRLFDLCYLALAGAVSAGRSDGRAAWVELAAVDCQQAAFFHGDVWERCLMAIDKGLVKVNSSHEKQWIEWHMLARKQASEH